MVIAGYSPRLGFGPGGAGRKLSLHVVGSISTDEIPPLLGTVGGVLRRADPPCWRSRPRTTSLRDSGANVRFGRVERDAFLGEHPQEPRVGQVRRRSLRVRYVPVLDAVVAAAAQHASHRPIANPCIVVKDECPVSGLFSGAPAELTLVVDISKQLVVLLAAEQVAPMAALAPWPRHVIHRLSSSARDSAQPGAGANGASVLRRVGSLPSPYQVSSRTAAAATDSPRAAASVRARSQTSLGMRRDRILEAFGSAVSFGIPRLYRRRPFGGYMS